MASVYVKGILDEGQLLNTKVDNEAQHQFTSVKVELSPHTDATRFGGLARSHILATIKEDSCDLASALFDEITIHWSW